MHPKADSLSQVLITVNDFIHGISIESKETFAIIRARSRIIHDSPYCGIPTRTGPLHTVPAGYPIDEPPALGNLNAIASPHSLPELC